jgi:NitT/TauT family transport system substrate-binding protein
VQCNKVRRRENPRQPRPLLTALDEANDFIAANKQVAAEIFARGSAVKVSVDQVLAMLNDKDTQFSATPNKAMDFAEFMHLVGSIKVKPAS